MDHGAKLMTSHLSSAQIESYWNRGFVHPLTAMSPSAALALIPRHALIHQRMAGWTQSKQLTKVHLVSRWVYEVTVSDTIVDAVESLLGANIMLYGATFFAKPPSQNLHVGWHQDLLYWGLEPHDGVATVWLALSDAKQDNGAMQVIGASHRNGFRRHSNANDDANMLNSHQNMELTELDQRERETVELEPGQFSIHHGMTLHGSGPNVSTRSRIGLSINYISTDVRQINYGGYDHAMLIRGCDQYCHFEYERPPVSEFDPESIAQFKRSISAPSGMGLAPDSEQSMVNFESIT